MDHVANQPSEVEHSGPLVFGANLLQPWLGANLVAFTIGLALAGGVLRAAIEPYYGSAIPAIEAARIQAAGAGTGTFLMGAVIGLAQWLVLRRGIRAAWWMPATCLGWTLAGVLGAFSAGGSTSTVGPAAGPVPAIVSLLVVTPLVIVLPGAGQWLILRRACERVGWWPLVNAGAFWAGGFVGITVAKLLPWIAGTHYPSAQSAAVAGVVAGPVYGYLTWQFLAQLRRRRA